MIDSAMINLARRLYTDTLCKYIVANGEETESSTSVLRRSSKSTVSFHTCEYDRFAVQSA